MAMVKEALIQNHAEDISNHEFRAPYVEETFQIQATEVEPRLQRICDRYNNLNAASHLVVLESGPYIYDPDLNLRVKAEAVRWMLRIAKHMSEPAREVVFLRIENSLRQLEAAVESRLRAAESFADSARPHRAARA